MKDGGEVEVSNCFNIQLTRCATRRAGVVALAAAAAVGVYLGIGQPETPLKLSAGDGDHRQQANGLIIFSCLHSTRHELQ